MNGIQKNSATYAGTLNNAGSIGIGAAGDGTANEIEFKGQIDDVRVYNYALTATQVQQVYNEGSAARYGQ